MRVRRADHVPTADLRKHCNNQPCMPDILRSMRLRYMGHVVRREPERYSNQLLFPKYVPGNDAQPKHSNNSIIDSYRQDLEWLGEANALLTKAQDRGQWRALVKHKCCLN